MHDSTADVLRAMILEQQRLLIRQANHLRGLVGLPPVDGAAVGDEPDGVGDVPHLLELTSNRRAVVGAIARCVVAGEAPTYTVLAHRAQVGKRALSRVLAWAVNSGVVTRTERGYLPGPSWAECVDGDVELLGLELGTQGTRGDT